MRKVSFLSMAPAAIPVPGPINIQDLHKLFNIAAVNLPGHGKSGGQGEQDIPQYVLRLKEILDVLKLEHPVLIGHSTGRGHCS